MLFFCSAVVHLAAEVGKKSHAEGMDRLNRSGAVSGLRDVFTSTPGAFLRIPGLRVYKSWAYLHKQLRQDFSG